MSLGMRIDDPESGIYRDDRRHGALLALWKCNKKRSSRIRKCIGLVWGSRETHVRKSEGRMKDAWDILYELMAPSVTSRFSSSIKPPPPPHSPRATYPPATLRWVFGVTLYVFLKSIHEWSKIQDQRLRLPHWGVFPLPKPAFPKVICIWIFRKGGDVSSPTSFERRPAWNSSLILMKLCT